MSNLRWTIRWHLQQRRPRPPWGEQLIDYIGFAAQGSAYTAVLIFTIGG